MYFQIIVKSYRRPYIKRGHTSGKRIKNWKKEMETTYALIPERLVGFIDRFTFSDHEKHVFSEAVPIELTPRQQHEIRKDGIIAIRTE